LVSLCVRQCRNGGDNAQGREIDEALRAKKPRPVGRGFE
jgi:hypothetical protein